MTTPWDDRVYRLIREFVADVGLPPTPSAEAMRGCLAGPGQLQVGSIVDERCGVIWFTLEGWSLVRGPCGIKKDSKGAPASAGFFLCLYGQCPQAEPLGAEGVRPEGQERPYLLSRAVFGGVHLGAVSGEVSRPRRHLHLDERPRKNVS